MDIILASKSKIRKEFLKNLGINFEVIVSNIDETFDVKKSFEDRLKEVSRKKAMSVFNSTSDRGKRIVIAADQNIIFHNKMYGKPMNIKEAKKFIQEMEGHFLYSYVGNCLIYANGSNIIEMINDCDISMMKMDKISDVELESYLNTCMPLTKCGGINIIDTPFLHLEKGRLSTSIGITTEHLENMLIKIQHI